MRLRSILLLLCASCFAVNAAPLTFFYFTSSPTSWVGQGESAFVSPEQGFTFRDYPSPWAEIEIIGAGYSRWWSLILGAPGGQPLTIGKYPTATTPGFDGPGIAILSFSGNGRGSNYVAGEFEIFDITRGFDGHLLSFAATFLQFDEGNPEAWNYGIVSYNSTAFAQVPEPGSIAVGAGLVFLIALRRLKFISYEKSVFAVRASSF